MWHPHSNQIIIIDKNDQKTAQNNQINALKCDLNACFEQGHTGTWPKISGIVDKYDEMKTAENVLRDTQD